MLLDDVIELATDGKQPITTLLRKCIVLAHQLKNDRLRTWVSGELNGYDPKKLPEYRILPAAATGTFVGPGWSRYQQGIPSFVLNEEHRDFAERVYVARSIGTLEEMVKATGSIFFPWSANLVAFYADKLTNDFSLFAARQEIPKSAIAGIIDTVRTRVLNLALELQSEIGGKDEDLKKITPEESKKLDQSIVNNIYGGNVYLSTGDSTMTATTQQQQQQNIVAGDWKHLEGVLKNVGIGDQDLKHLSKVIESEGDQKLSDSGAVMKWIKATAPKVLTGGVKMGAEIGKSVLTEILMQYYGLKP